MTFLTFEGHIREIIGNAGLAPEQKLAAIEAFLDASEKLIEVDEEDAAEDNNIDLAPL